MARVLAHLTPLQIGHRLRLRGNRTISALPVIGDQVIRRITRPSNQAGWPHGFQPVDQRDPPEATTADQLRRREFDLVGVTHTAGDGRWEPAEVSQLWRYHLHYFEWAWALVGEVDGADVFEELWRDWHRSAQPGRGDAWSPYAASLRAWTMCGLHEYLVKGRSLEGDYRESLAVHAGYVLHNIELDVGGNHLMKNIKALLGLGVFLDDDRLLQRGRKLLEREVRVQVLPDGGHYERSPSYHAQVLADLIDIHDLLDAAGDDGATQLVDPIGRMARFLSAMVMPDRTVPLLRDCVPVSPARLDALGIAREAEPPRLQVLPDSGYVIVRVGPFHAVLDVGQPCPRRLPAHAQADSLNWVLHVDDQPVIVDTGTSSYQDPAVRAYERSTAAHNTVEVDGENSTEVFGAFRAGRRARVRLIQAADDGDTITVTAEHDGYRFLDGSPVHRRSWTISESGIEVRDSVDGAGAHHVVARLVLAARVDDLPVVIETVPPATSQSMSRAHAMGIRHPATVLEAPVKGSTPMEIVTIVHGGGRRLHHW